MIDDNLGVKLKWDLLKNELKKAPDKVKVRELRRVMRAELDIVVKTARQHTPVRDNKKAISRGSRIKKGISQERFREPGNLQKSIGIIASRKRAALYVRPRFGNKQKYDGFYGHMVHNGTRFTTKKTPFMSRAYEATKNVVGTQLDKKVARAIAKSLTNLGVTVQ